MDFGYPPLSKYLTLRDLSVHYLEWSRPTSSPQPTVLFLHGFSDVAASWGPIAEKMTHFGHRVIAPDLRGFGQTDWIGDGGYYHFPDYIADMDALLRALELERIYLVGHSMGGTVATLFAGSRPEKIERLALLEGLGPIETSPEYAPDRLRKWLDDLQGNHRNQQRTMSLEEARQRLARQHPEVPSEQLDQRLPTLIKEESPGRFSWHLDPLHRTTSPTPFFAATYRAFAARIHCPVLLLDGGPSGYHPPDEPERKAAFPNAETRSLGDIGHMMHWSHPQLVAKELLQFFSPETP